MAQTAITFRVDQTLKNNFDALCEDFGLSITSAFTIFMKAVVRERKIPFEIKLSNMTDKENIYMDNIMSIRETAMEYGIQDMSIDEINEEIKAVREKR
ncbi:MAG: type II toxin-antitoxin system RelB/DinJ family antitoxin [Muribaculaceae bacterium]|nr:type II toxin-antitoxin system RelB/DinJ family antitoxin [Muribaculaceae bacterium]